MDSRFAENFLSELRKVMKAIHPGIKEIPRDGVLFFEYKGTKYCFFNAYPGGVQFVWSNILLKGERDIAYDFAANDNADRQDIQNLLASCIKGGINILNDIGFDK